MTESRSATGATPRPDPIVRGFLFADLRGYTEFVERSGDAAAAELLERYRVLVRGVIAEQAGAEIRTEGDSFYVVFPSPSAAVRAGLELVAAAATDAADHPADPIRVGVGVHAGESAETAEGFVGSAVNVAARICSIARPGEVLVSGTVRGLTRTSLGATFTSRGRKRLKGVAEPIELWAAQPAGEAIVPVARASRVPSPRARVGLILLGASVVSIAVVAIGAITAPPSRLASGSPLPEASDAGAVGSPSPTPGGSTGIMAFHTGTLEAGTYRTTAFDPPISFTVGPGMSGAVELPNAVVIALADDPERADLVDSTMGTRLSIMRPTVGVHSCQVALPLNRGPYRDPLDLPPDIVERLPTDREGLIDWVRTDDGIDVEAMDVVGSAGGDAVQLDVRIAPDCLAADSAAKPIFPLDGPTYYLIRPGERIRWYITDVDGRPLIFAVNGRPDRFDGLDSAARSLARSVKLLGDG